MQVAWVSQLAQKYNLPLRPATGQQEQQEQHDSGLRRSLIEHDVKTLGAGGSSEGKDSSSSSSSVGGGEEAQGGRGQLQAVTEEARVWVKEKFQPAARVAR